MRVSKVVRIRNRVGLRARATIPEWSGPQWRIVRVEISDSARASVRVMIWVEARWGKGDGARAERQGSEAKEVRHGKRGKAVR